MKTIYIKVPVSERLPEKSGDNFIIDPNGKKAIGLFIYEEFQRLVTPEYWLDEKPDYEDDMIEMLEDLDHVKDDILQALDHANNSSEDYQYIFDKAKELLTKLKTE